MRNIQKKKRKEDNKENNVRFRTKLKKIFKYQPKESKPKQPKSYQMRKLGAMVFWLLFLFMFLVVLVVVTSNSSTGGQTNATVDEAQKNDNPSMKPEAIQFAKEFVGNYFTWNIEDDGWKKREERLSAYLAEGLDEQAGLVTENLDWDATFEDATIQKIDEITENKSHIIFQVNAEMTREGGEENKKETEPFQNYFAVPVVHNGSTYGVYELPYMTNVDEQTDVEVDKERDYSDLENVAAGEEVTNIKNFLDTFFTSYAEDSEDRLSYILEDTKYQHGLNGALDFIEVKRADVYEGKQANEFIVVTTVTFEDPALQTRFDTVYNLVVAKDDDHYIVSKLNAEKEINDIVTKD